MTRNEIIDFCLDNRNLSDEELSKRLMNKLERESYPPFKHGEKSAIVACGLENSPFIKGEETFFSESMPEKLTTSEVVEYFEKRVGKRELCFLFTNSIRANSKLQEEVEKLKKLLKRLM